MGLYSVKSYLSMEKCTLRQNVSDMSAKPMPLCLLFVLLSGKLNSSSPAPSSAKFAYLAMTFILQLEFSSRDHGENGEHNGVGLYGDIKIIAMQDAFVFRTEPSDKG